jgi:hypothetical protein
LRRQQHVGDVVDRGAVLLPQPHDDRVLVATVAVEGRLGPGHVGADRFGDSRNAEAQQRGLGAVHLDLDLGAPIVLAEARVGDARRGLHHPEGVLGDPAGILEVVAANLERQPAVAAAAEHPVHLEVATGRIGAGDDARQARELAAEVLRDLLVRALALIARNQPQVERAAMRLRAAERPEAAAADVRDEQLRFRHRAADHLLETQHHRLGALDARADRQLGGDVHLSFVGLRHQLGTDHRQHDHGGDEHRGGDSHHRGPVHERQANEARVALIHCREEALAGMVEGAEDAALARRFLRQVQHARAEHRHDRDRHEQRHREREDHDDRERSEHDAGDARQEQQRDEDRDVRQRGGEDGRPDFLAGVDRRGHPVLAQLHVPERVLQHDNRRVYDHADAQREAAKGHRVEGVAAEVEQCEGADHRYRDRRADDERGAEVAQEGEDDQHDEDAADHRVLLDVVDRALDEDFEAYPRHLAVDALHLSAHAFRDGDGVAARLLLDRHANARASVDAHHRTAVLGGVLHLGDVAEVDGHAALG